MDSEVWEGPAGSLLSAEPGSPSGGDVLAGKNQDPKTALNPPMHHDHFLGQGLGLAVQMAWPRSAPTITIH